MVVREEWYVKCSKFKNWYSPFIPLQWRVWQNFIKCKRFFPCNLWKNKEEILINGVINYRYAWIVILSALTITSAIIVLHYPKLQLPNSSEFQLFDSSHPFEQYDLHYKQKFWFERSERVSHFLLLLNSLSFFAKF